MSWPMVNLGSLFKVTSGGTPSRAVAEYYEDGQIPWVKTGDLHNKYVEQASEYITEAGLKSSSTRLYPAGTVLVAMYGATIGACSILAIEACTNQACAAFTPNPNVDVDYLYYFLKHSKTAFVNAGAGGAQPNISAGFLKDYEIPLPPLAEQKRIAAILDKADAIRRKRQQAIQLADDFLRAVFLEMFGDPVTNPKGFPTRFLSDFYVDLRTGTKCGPFGSALKKDEYQDSGIPVWNMDNISLSGVFNDSPNLWISDAKCEELEAYSVEDGDVIISRAGTVGKMGVVRSKYRKSIISTNLIRVRFGETLRPEYFVNLMNYCKGRIGRLKTGPDGSFTHMNTGILDSIEFPYPPIKLQDKYLNIKKSVFAANERSGQYEIGLLFDSLSQKAFSGHL